jgi:nucleoside-diphosphate-sugar epimerase
MAIVAVTGATGFIGRHTLPLLLEHGHQVRALVRPGSERNLPFGIEASAGDVVDRSSLDQLTRGAEIVLHLAGVAHTDLDGTAERELARNINVGGATNLLESAKRNGVRRVVVASSVHVYAEQAGESVKEDAPLVAENFYAATKIEVEKTAREFSGSGLEVVIGRPCLTYGPGVQFNLFRLMKAIDRGTYFHAGRVKVERSFGSVYSAAAAFRFLAEKGKPGEAYNIADERAMLLEDFTNDIADRIKRKRPKRLPYAALWTTAAGFSALKPLGLRGPINLESLNKLTRSFSVSTAKLSAAGFIWPDTGERGRQEMVNSYLAACTG